MKLKNTFFLHLLILGKVKPCFYYENPQLSSWETLMSPFSWKSEVDTVLSIGKGNHYFYLL